MLLTHRIVSIPQTLTPIKDPINASLISTNNSSALQYFNMRVTERLHRYRSMKRQWNEVATVVQTDSSLISKSDSNFLLPDIVSLTQDDVIKDYFNSTTIKNSNTFELDPLHNLIQNDLIQLRKLIKARHRKLTEHLITKTMNSKLAGENNLTDEQEKSSIRKLLSSNKPNPLNRVKISGNSMRPSQFPPSTSFDSTTNNSTLRKTSIASSQQTKIKQQNIQKVFNIYRVRVNNTLPSDSLIQGVPPPQQRIQTAAIAKTSVKQPIITRSTVPIIIPVKKQTIFVKTEPIPPIIKERTARNSYTFAASTSSATPRSMQLNRKTSLLPILLNSSSCIGIQPNETHLENQQPTYTLVDYKNLIHHLPEPIVSIPKEYTQDDYEILFNQLDHIREHMSDTQVYEDYTRED